MKTTVAVLVLVVVAAGTVYTQSPPAGSQIPPPDVPTFPSPASQPAARKEPTLDQLLDQIERIREQKAELDRQEQALAAEARKKIVKQSERLNRLGLGTPVPAPINTTSAPELVPSVPGPILPGSGAPAPPPFGR